MAIRPVYRPEIIKKRTKKFIRHQSDRYGKLKVSSFCCFTPKHLNGFYWQNIEVRIGNKTFSLKELVRQNDEIFVICMVFFRGIGENQRVSTTEWGGVSRDSIWCPTLVMVQPPKPVICYPQDSGKCWSTIWRWVWFCSPTSCGNWLALNLKLKRVLAVSLHLVVARFLFHSVSLFQNPMQ